MFGFLGLYDLYAILRLRIVSLIFLQVENQES